MRQSRRWPSDAALFDAALAALDAAEQATHIDAAYVRAYDAHPADEPDEYGELGAWREAAGGS